MSLIFFLADCTLFAQCIFTLEDLVQIWSVLVDARLVSRRFQNAAEILFSQESMRSYSARALLVRNTSMCISRTREPESQLTSSLITGSGGVWNDDGVDESSMCDFQDAFHPLLSGSNTSPREDECVEN